VHDPASGVEPRACGPKMRSASAAALSDIARWIAPLAHSPAAAGADDGEPLLGREGPEPLLGELWGRP